VLAGRILAAVPGSFAIPYAQLHMEEPLGSGAGGVVSAGQYFSATEGAGSSNSVPVAIKAVVVAGLVEEDLELIGREVRILASLRHPNIVSFIGISQSPRGALWVGG
jgi:serine/threonine protein kinase